MKRNLVLFGLFVGFLGVSWRVQFQPGMAIFHSFVSFSWSLIKVVPCAFIIIGLFDVWIKRETVEKHLGEGSKMLGYFWVFALAATTVGGLFVALPVAAALARKGARTGMLFTYLAAATITRVPMTIFEATFVGIKFTIIRFVVSLPLLILASEAMAKLFPHFQMQEKE